MILCRIMNQHFLHMEVLFRGTYIALKYSNYLQYYKDLPNTIEIFSVKFTVGSFQALWLDLM